MSRVGKLPILLPNEVKLSYNSQLRNIIVEGTKGTLAKTFCAGEFDFSINSNKFEIKPLSDDKTTKAMWGTIRSIVASMVKGVTEGFVQELEINGVGYRASVKEKYLTLGLGKSHQTKIEIPEIVSVNILKQNVISVFSIDKERLGQFVALIVRQRSPEPYKGKGIKKVGSYIQRKSGKKS